MGLALSLAGLVSAMEDLGPSGGRHSGTSFGQGQEHRSANGRHL